MQISVRTMAFTIVFLFVGSFMAGLTSEYNGMEPEILEEETIVQNPSQATSPGHVSLANTSLLTTVVIVPRLVVVGCSPRTQEPP